MDEFRLDGDEPTAPTPERLRHEAAAALLASREIVTSDAVAVFPRDAAQVLDAEYCRRLGELLVNLLSMAVRDSKLDARGGFVADLYRTTLERPLPIERLFSFLYVIERTALDELALNESIGATTEPWPLVAQLVRRASFDLLAAYTERAQQDPGNAVIIDRLTTIHIRPVFDAALSKELERASRVGYSVSLILFDLDRLTELNRTHGYGVGDRILERLGITIRTYFRQHDWVARYSEDSIAVLLPQTRGEDAAELAEHVRAMVEERLGFRDLAEGRVKVTVSAAVASAQIELGDPLDPDRLMAEAEATLERAKRGGRNRVERVEVAAASYSPAEAAKLLRLPPARIRKLVANGTLSSLGSGRQTRISRASVEAQLRSKDTSLLPNP